ncbi:hypothetical protein M9H77_02551 [Catharanthus roseus]|uniref:Uncharacterized protein n=1 Tax=Catharanthus roseus TaxID=4058 RepID=A0ACC0C8U4_CATRO|nr:hypothetical protein M9H77_02551 [Catharanthus roseus]
MAFLFTNTNEKPHSDQGVSSRYDIVFGSVRGLHLLPRELCYSFQTCSLVPRGTQKSYSSAFGLVPELGVSQMQAVKKAKSIITAKRCGEKQLSVSPERVTKVETLKPSMIDGFSKVNELPQVTMEVEESVVLHVKEEISNVEHYDLMRKRTKKKRALRLKKKKEIEDKGRNMEKVLDNFLKEFTISLSLNPSLMCYEVSLVGLELFPESYVSHVSIYGDLCAISFGEGLLLVVSYAFTCLSSHVFLEDSLLHSGSIFDPSCHDFGVINNASIESIVLFFIRCFPKIVLSCTFKEFFDKMVLKEECRPFGNFRNFSKWIQIWCKQSKIVFLPRMHLTSFHGLTRSHKSFNKALSMLTSLLMDVPKKKTGI